MCTRPSKWKGLYDADIRLEEMDREGIAGEFVNNGDGRIVALFFEAGNRVQSADACRAGVRAYHRWLTDMLGAHQDRCFLVGAVGSGPCAELDPVLAELDWIADRGYVATSIPGKTEYPGEPPLADPHWEPFWAKCAERGLHLWIHAGQGQGQASLSREVDSAYEQFDSVGRDPDRFWEILVTSVFNGQLLDLPSPRQAMWQLMFSGVFDRHPEPQAHDERGARRLGARHAAVPRRGVGGATATSYPPSAARASTGRATARSGCRSCTRPRSNTGTRSAWRRMSFGRDYPHSEGTWPNTIDWLADACGGLPEDELRLILGENAIRDFGLDREHLAQVAAGSVRPSNRSPVRPPSRPSSSSTSRPARWIPQAVRGRSSHPRARGPHAAGPRGRDCGLSDDVGHLEQRLGLTGKVAVVAGGAAGLGRACVDELAAAGMDVAVCDRDLAALAATADRHRDGDARGATVEGDVRDPEVLDALFAGRPTTSSGGSTR